MVTASPNSQRHTYSYDGIGTRRSLDASGAGRFTSVYDLASQLTSLRNPYSERTTFSYDDSGRRTVQRNANGTRVSTAYDAASQTSQVIHRPAAGSPLLQLDYRYDNAGNRKVLIEGGGTARVTWSYDAQNQLTGEHRTGTNAYRQTYTFDPAGNRTLKNLGGTRTTYGYDSANQLRYGQAVAGRTTFQYDLTGNQRIEQPPTGNRTTTTWNYENQPTQYRLPTGSPVTMAYNGDNRRISLQQGASTTKFVWDSVIDAYVKELDGSNVVQAVYTSEPQHYGAVLSQRRGSTSHILHADALGTTRLLTTSAGASSDTYLFDAWGNLITSSGTTVNPFRWVGRYGYYMDSSTGLVYVRARMYVPVVARWASLDPQSPIRWHAYSYVENGPERFIDPSGKILVAIDGTSSREFREESGSEYGKGLLRSHVRNFRVDYRGTEPYYDDGPSYWITGLDAQSIENRAYEWVCRMWCTKRTPPPECARKKIDMVGHSRGGFIVMQLAHRLNESGCLCSDGTHVPVPIRFVGLCDPVDMAPVYPEGRANSDQLARNVETWAIVVPKPFRLPDGSVGELSRGSWRRVIQLGPRGDRQNQPGSVLAVEASHSAIGGAPGQGDKPAGWTSEKDVLGSITADQFIRRRAISVGVPIQMKTAEEYGY